MPSIVRSKPLLWRRRSGAGLLIVVLLLAHLFLFGTDQCPVRPADRAQLLQRDSGVGRLPQASDFLTPVASPAR